MLNITTLDFDLRYLSDEFYKEIAPNLIEVLTKVTRPYCVLLVKVKGLKFAIPLRSNLPECNGIGIKTIENEDNKGRFKGIDFSKAVIITDEKYLKNDRVILKRTEELLFIKSQDRKICREFKKYVDTYIAQVKYKRILDAKYEFSTLKNYHKELKIE